MNQKELKYKMTKVGFIMTEEERWEALRQKLTEEEYVWLKSVTIPSDENMDKILELFIKAGIVEVI
jgi:hypothetical protein